MTKHYANPLWDLAHGKDKPTMATSRRKPVDVPEPTRAGREKAAKKAAKKPAQKTMYNSAIGLARKRVDMPTDAKMADILGIKFLLLGAEPRDGENGTFYIMTLRSLEDDKRYRVITGSMAICDVLEALEKDDLPVAIEFEQRGRGYFITEPDDEEDDEDDEDDEEDEDLSF